MVHQQIAGQGGQPGGKCPFFNIIAAQSAVELDEDVLGQVLGVIRGVGKAVAEVINPAVVQADNLLPCRGVPAQASADKYPCLLLLFQQSPGINTLGSNLLFQIYRNDVKK